MMNYDIVIVGGGPAGMGRCQGGFCTTFITELLAKEQGIDETEVTKFGAGSYMLCGKTK